MADTVAERKHHPRSPSKLQLLEACPSFKGRDDVAHERAIAGTMAHRVVDTEEDDQKLSDSDAEMAAQCLDFAQTRRDYMQGIADEARESWRANMERMGAAYIPDFSVREIKEIYLPIDACKYADTDCTTGGYIDHGFISWGEDYAEVIDWKFGFWPVEKAENNLQGIAYCLGMFHKYPRLKRVRFWFKQPALDYVTDAVFTREQIPALYLRVKTVCERAIEGAKRFEKEDFSMCRPHVPVCLFCANIGKCGPVTDFALRTAKKFHPVQFPEEITAHKLKDPKQTTLAMNLVSVLKVFCDGFRRTVTDQVLRGARVEPEGYKIQNSTGRSKIVDAEKMKNIALGYLSLEEYSGCLEASFGDLGKKISEKAPRGSKESTVKEFRAKLEESGAVHKGEPFSFLRAVSED